eukprot:403341101
MPIELPCTAKMCKKRNACLTCVKIYIQARKKEDGTFPCCYSDQHTIPSDYLFETDTDIYDQLVERDKLTIKCMKHDNEYVEDYCHACEELICFRCVPAHKKHFRNQGGNSSFTPERFKNYLMFVRPKLEEIALQISQTLKIFNTALSNDEEYYAEEIMQWVKKTFTLLQHRLTQNESINMLHLHYEKYGSSITPDPQNYETKNLQEEIKQDNVSDQQKASEDYKALVSRLRYLELQQKYCNDNLRQDSKTQKEFIKHVSEEMKKTEEFLNFQENLNQKLENSISDTNQQSLMLDSQINTFRTQIDDQIHSMELSIKEQSLAFEKEIGDQKFEKQRIDKYLVQLKKDVQWMNNIRSINDIDQTVDALKEVELKKYRELFRKLVNIEIKQKEKSLINQHISNSFDRSYKLLFCGSRDGFKANKFHELCDNQGPTVSFILSNYGQVFGGYASQPWTSPNESESFKDDADAFIFSLRYTFDFPNGCKYGSNEARSYLAAQYQFKVLEIEVYSLPDNYTDLDVIYKLED